MSITIEKNTLVLPARKPKEQRARFDMFVRLKKHAVFRFPGGKEEWTYRGDKFCKENPDPAKMLRYLLGIVKNRCREYHIIQLYDNTIPYNHQEELVLYMLNGIAKQNLIPNYGELIKDFYLPEDLAVLIKPS